MGIKIENKHLKKKHSPRLKQNTSTKIENRRYSFNHHIYINELDINKKKFIKLIIIDIVEKILADIQFCKLKSASICC